MVDGLKEPVGRRAPPVPDVAEAFPLTIRQSIDMFLLGINYRFLGGPPKF